MVCTLQQLTPPNVGGAWHAFAPHEQPATRNNTSTWVFSLGNPWPLGSFPIQPYICFIPNGPTSHGNDFEQNLSLSPLQRIVCVDRFLQSSLKSGGTGAFGTPWTGRAAGLKRSYVSARRLGTPTSMRTMSLKPKPTTMGRLPDFPLPTCRRGFNESHHLTQLFNSTSVLVADQRTA